MAAECPFVEKDLTCPLCYEVFNDPVTLNCNHSFCKRCIHTRWECRGLQQCPVCYCTANSSRPSINQALRRASDVFKQKPEHFMVRSMERCSIHNEELKLFCQKDAELICSLCTSTRSHANHKYCSITEATSEIMRELTAKYNPLKKNLSSFEKLKESLEELEAYIQTQAVETAEEIKKEYKNLHEFLMEDERARLLVLKNETKCKTEVVREQLKEIKKIIEELTDIIDYVEPITIADDLSFLKECKEAIKRTTYIVPKSEYPAGALIDVFQYLGSLKHGVWKQMERAVNRCPVNFDPNTAHPNLIISDELTSVQYGKKQQVPDNPERCISRMAVLAACGFSSGKHCWHVEVLHNSEWYIGVARKSIRRQSSVFLNPTDGFWVIGLSNEEYWAQTSPRTRLNLKRKPQIVTVELDYDKGKVSFSNTADGTSIYSFKDRFTESMFPYFSIGINQGSTLRIRTL